MAGISERKGKEGCNYGSIEYLQSGEDIGGTDELETDGAEDDQGGGSTQDELFKGGT